eukprot:gnl/TRDRNA2_/TRDRNA2_192050_c0_seq1.p1 gnl/TRDRNA2_/TRDRNA2_192050_c0~~gnl/TRDRNA2_/TRDRNA2_192050_c0_seq1.p1  ORF type:complete len:288 (-),score=72.98 gnl/TRDRNA2_/TRDRNA2_192050_c0_seq1:100-963(-)
MVKVTLRYEESDDKELHMILRLTLPQKYVTGPCKDVIKLFVDHYNKKRADTPLEAEKFHLKIAGGDHLDRDERVKDSLKEGDECYLLSDWNAVEPRKPEKAAEPAPPAAKPEAPAAAGYEGEAKKPVAKKDEQGRVKCKHFGCNKMFDPNGPPEPCVYHKSPPIFHEVAKWWSCCQDKKAYDWDDFMKIPGCQQGFCTATPENQGQKRFLGGTDLRGDSAPVRIDGVVEPHTKLAGLRKGFVAIGMNAELFDKVVSQLSLQHNGDQEKVLEAVRDRLGRLMGDPDRF